MSQPADAASTPASLTGEQVLDVLEELAALEHAHCVYHLRLHYAFGGDLPAGHRPVPDGVGEAATAALLTAQGDMFHLRDVNRILARAGREPVLRRATHVAAGSGPPLALHPLTPADFEEFPRRELALAAALDQGYVRLGGAGVSPTPPLTAELLDELQSLVEFATGGGAGHGSAATAVAAALAGLRPSEYLLVTGTEPADELDHRLLALSDEFYQSVLGILAEHFADVEGLGPPLRQQAVSRMGDLHTVNGLLGLRTLIPPFTAPAS